MRLYIIVLVICVGGPGIDPKFRQTKVKKSWIKCSFVSHAVGLNYETFNHLQDTKRPRVKDWDASLQNILKGT